MEIYHLSGELELYNHQAVDHDSSPEESTRSSSQTSPWGMNNNSKPLLPSTAFFTHIPFLNTPYLDASPESEGSSFPSLEAGVGAWDCWAADTPPSLESWSEAPHLVADGPIPSLPLEKAVRAERRRDQNRKAQRAYRARKDKLIEECELKVRELEAKLAEAESRSAGLEEENQELRGSIAVLRQTLLCEQQEQQVGGGSGDDAPTSTTTPEHG